MLVRSIDICVDSNSKISVHLTAKCTVGSLVIVKELERHKDFENYGVPSYVQNELLQCF